MEESNKENRNSTAKRSNIEYDESIVDVTAVKNPAKFISDELVRREIIVLAGQDIALAMKLCGVKKSFAIKNREEGLKILESVKKDDFIIASLYILKMLPELLDYSHMVSIPDNYSDFTKIDDLKYVIKSAIGFDIEV